MLLKSIILIGFMTFCAASDLSDDKIPRKLTSYYNPGCEEFCSSEEKKNLINVLYVTADSDTDRIHYLWSFVGQPSFLMAQGDLNSNISIDWDSFLGFSNGTEKSVKITPTPKYTHITVLKNIFEFNDPEDHGDFKNVSDKNILALDTAKFNYEFNNTVNTTDFIEFSVQAKKYHYNKTDEINIGTIHYTIQCYGSKGHGTDYPHLLHNSNNTQIDIVFDKFKQKKSFHAPRLAIEMIFATTDDKNATFKISKRRTLDDEHTPAIFELDSLVSPKSYVEYRPVSYTKKNRDVSDSTDTHLNQIVNIDNFMYKSLIGAYFGLDERRLTQGTNVSFGSVNDGFYSKTNYTSFTFLIGYGVPPTEELSTLVIIIIIIGLGLPAVLLMLGATCICVKRVQNYRRLSNVP